MRNVSLVAVLPSPLLPRTRTAHDFRWFLVLPDAQVAGVPQVTVRRPFDELELPDQHRLEPNAA